MSNANAPELQPLQGCTLLLGLQITSICASSQLSVHNVSMLIITWTALHNFRAAPQCLVQYLTKISFDNNHLLKREFANLLL